MEEMSSFWTATG